MKPLYDRWTGQVLFADLGKGASMRIIGILAAAAVVAISTAAMAEDTVADLTEVVFDRELAIVERVDALDSIRREDQSAYLESLSKLIDGDEEILATYSAEQLVSLVIMIGGHAVTDHPAGQDSPRHAMTLVEDVTKILREHVVSRHGAVREIVATYLASRGDESAIDDIRKATEEGRMSDSEALGYYLAAPPDVGASDLRHYAENGSDDLARRAIEVLSSDTSQQFYVRETILTNLEADKERRIVALAGLAKYDKAFASYATLPPVIDLALVADQVPGAEGMSGTDLISRAVQLNIQANPGLRDFYTRRIEESSEAFRDVPAAMEEIQRSLIAPLRDG